MTEALVLNIDDQEAARYVRTRLLKQAGYRVREAGSGAQALELLETGSFDLVLLDVNLPDMSGLEVCRRIKAKPAWADLPVLHVSASAVEPADAAIGLEGGADGYLTEPVDPAVLLATVRALLRARQAERERRRMEARLHRLIESNLIGVAIATMKGIVEANDAFLKLGGWSREDLAAGRVDWLAATPPELRHLDERALAELRERGACAPFEKEYVRSGQRVPFLIGAAALEQSPEFTWVCYAVDLTEHKRLERQLLAAQKMESVGVLAGGIAHDFNNLLTGIMGNIGLTLETLSPMDPGRDQLQDALRGCQRAADLTSQLLAYAGKGRFLIRRLDLSQTVSAMSRLIRASVPRKIEIRMDLAGDLPLVEADTAQLQQLAMNLAANAAEAIGDQPGEVRISTGIETVDSGSMREFVDSEELAPGPHVYLEVRDTGCGMDEAARAKIFDPFYTTKFVGRGLGLAAVAGIVRAHRGAVRVTSAPGQGSTFRVLLPVAAQALAPRPATSSARGAVLVVDDEEIVRNVTRAALQQAGYEVLLAEDGLSAVETFRKAGDRIAVVLLDMAMPSMSGDEALQHLRSIRPRVQVIVSTGFSQAEAEMRFAGQPVDAFIHKPYTPQQLVAKVREVVGGQVNLKTDESVR